MWKRNKKKGKKEWHFTFVEKWRWGCGLFGACYSISREHKKINSKRILIFKIKDFIYLSIISELPILVFLFFYLDLLFLRDILRWFNFAPSPPILSPLSPVPFPPNTHPTFYPLVVLIRHNLILIILLPLSFFPNLLLRLRTDRNVFERKWKTLRGYKENMMQKA